MSSNELYKRMSSGFISQNDINKQDDHREENEKDRKWREAYERLNNDDSSKNNEYTDSDKNKSLAEIMSERKQQKYQELEDKSKFCKSKTIQKSQ